MKLLMPLGVLLVVIGMAGSATACLQNSEGEHAVERPTGQIDTQVAQGEESSSGMWLAPLSGLCLAAGFVFMGVGVGHWRRPIPSDVRPANPWSDQPREHGDPPKGLV